MRYLITTNQGRPFLTDWFNAENDFDQMLDMIVYDLYKQQYTTDGKTWKGIHIDMTNA